VTAAATPRVILAPVTGEARAALGGVDHIVVSTFPFRIGREARTNPIARAVATLERRLQSVPQLNDLYLIDQAEPLQISRSHCEIEHTNGCFFLRDRASATGTNVVRAATTASRGAVRVLQAGGISPETRVELGDGDLIVLGAHDSPYVFRFQVESRAGSKTFENRLVVVLEADFISNVQQDVPGA